MAYRHRVDDGPRQRRHWSNGLEISTDGQWFYIAGFRAELFIRLSRGQTPVRKDAVALGFSPDNLRMAPDGSIFAVGMAEHRTPAETSNVAKVDPNTLEVERIFRHPSIEGFTVSTTVVQVGNELWLGTYGGDRIARLPAPQ